MEPQYFDRDVSWLSFNHRVLKEASDPKVPVFERLRFIAIYSSNLDEFFRVRVAGIRRIQKIGLKKINKKLDIKPNKLLQEIKEKVNIQLDEFGNVLREHVLKDLEKEGFFILKPDALTDAQSRAALFYFKESVMAFLQPYILDITSRKPFLDNRAMYLALTLKHHTSGEIRHAYLNIPTNKLPRFLKLPSDQNNHCYIYLDDIIRLHLDFVFPDYEVVESCSIKLNKDADLLIEDEYSGDLVAKIQKQIKKRNLGVPSRFLFDRSVSDELKEKLVSTFDLSEDDLVPGGRYHNLYDFFQLSNPLKKELEYEPMPAVHYKSIDAHRSIFDAIDESDMMLHFPYHSYNYILQFFNQAAIDPYVTEIKITFYRMAANSFIGDALISAATNGKKVTVFIELKARFDEANNLVWAERMQDAGIKVIYSIPGLKVHAKIAIVKKELEDGSIRHYSFFGTGNMNESTAKIYSDFGLLTSHTELGQELNSVFKYLYKKKEPKTLDNILVSQFNMIDRFIEMIDQEITNAKAGKKARIVIKLNNLQETAMIDKLYEASCAGVKIEMIVRSICCLIPGIKGLSENITVRRIVDRYLEHARIFLFHNDGKEKIFMGSADWMSRNLKNRIEVTFPIYDESLKTLVSNILNLQLTDNVKAVMLNEKMEHVPVVAGNDKLIRAQMESYDYIKSL